MIALTLITSFSCRSREDAGSGMRTGKLKVVTSLFPVYDFARAVGGSNAEVTLLLPPGVEPHSFEPKPADMVKLNSADIFIYTNRYMEPWIGDIMKSVDGSRVLIVDASRGVDFLEMTDGDHTGEGGTEESVRTAEKNADPHIWLDFSNAQIMVETIRDAFIIKAPQNRESYRKNAEGYRKELDALDRKYRESLSRCRKKTMVDGGHYTFGYLARRYGLAYIAAYGFSPDAEPTARDLARISGILGREGLKHLFYEELLTPRVARTIARETGTSLLRLHGAHNVSREELRRGTTFPELMEKNLGQLMTGLQCR
ncbi:MAG: zinc ABC transporter substrate-binding protein [Nitrospirae bacterium]|nr:zinc ABC transporter substrate-binding protein [Nitrospirota bacterium]